MRTVTKFMSAGSALLVAGADLAVAALTSSVAPVVKRRGLAQIRSSR